MKNNKDIKLRKAWDVLDDQVNKRHSGNAKEVDYINNILVPLIEEGSKEGVFEITIEDVPNDLCNPFVMKHICSILERFGYYTDWKWRHDAFGVILNITWRFLQLAQKEDLDKVLPKMR